MIFCLKLPFAPYLINGFPLAALAKMVPIPVLELIAEGERGPYPGIVPGKKTDRFGIGSVHCGIGAAPSAHKGLGLGIVRNPLKAGAGKDLHGLSGPGGPPHLDLAVLLPTGNQPGPAEFPGPTIIRS